MDSEGMTVGQLIHYLSGFPKDMRVLVDGYEDGFDDPVPPDVYTGRRLPRCPPGGVVLREVGDRRDVRRRPRCRDFRCRGCAAPGGRRYRTAARRLTRPALPIRYASSIIPYGRDRIHRRA